MFPTRSPWSGSRSRLRLNTFDIVVNINIIVKQVDSGSIGWGHGVAIVILVVVDHVPGLGSPFRPDCGDDSLGQRASGRIWALKGRIAFLGVVTPLGHDGLLSKLGARGAEGADFPGHVLADGLWHEVRHQFVDALAGLLRHEVTRFLRNVHGVGDGLVVAGLLPGDELAGVLAAELLWQLRALGVPDKLSRLLLDVSENDE